ncbi:MAG: hypothetical protein PWQ91_1044 [Eubacteriales bacterium]|nr:hypothetical protein [Eubacteriales bacterium]
MAKPQLDKTLTALAGGFLVAGNLCLRGYVASLTLKNYPKVDIFCLNPKNGKQIAIQVKTKRGGKQYYVPENIDEFDQPYVFVYIHPDDKVDFYIVPSQEVARLSAWEREKYLQDRPHVSREQPRMLSIETIQKFKDRWDLLGLD